MKNYFIKIKILILLFSLFSINSIYCQVNYNLPAFPQAEGFGAYTIGGRGGKVIFVDNLNDKGPGSLREAIGQNEPRIIIFRVSGTIELQSDLIIEHPFVTIAGHTAPGDGICLKNFPLKIFRTNDVIVRGIRIRPGIQSLKPGTTSDGIAIEFSRNIIVDHCSASWSTDEILNTNNQNTDITIQWSIFSESLNDPFSQREHGYAATIGGMRASYHHNLFAHNKGRNPSIGGGDRDRRSELDIINNVVYNWKTRVCDGKPHAVNFIANYYKPGPATPYGKRKVIAEIQSSQRYGFHSKWFIQDNFIEGFPELAEDNWSGSVRFRSGCSIKENQELLPFDNGNFFIRDPKEAYLSVLMNAGVVTPKRDEVDNRIIREVLSGTATFGNGIIDDVTEVGGWPKLSTYNVQIDSDNDGIPNDWEIAEGLNPNDPSDRLHIKDGEVYDNLERYLNELASNQDFLLPPINLKGTFNNLNYEVSLDWIDISDNEDGFIIQRSNSSGGFSTIGKVGAGVTRFVDSNLTPDQKTRYRVIAYKGNRTSISSIIIDI